MLKKATHIISHHHTHHLEAPVATVTLNFQQRQCRRRRLQTDSGLEFILDLPQSVVLAEKDGLQLEDGTWVLVQAAPKNTRHIHKLSLEQLYRIAQAVHLQQPNIVANILEHRGLEIDKPMWQRNFRFDLAVP